MSTEEKPATVKYLTPDRDGKPIFVEVAAPVSASKQQSDTSKER